jgi:hypothetical protein
MMTGGGANCQLKALIEVLAPFTWSTSATWCCASRRRAVCFVRAGPWVLDTIAATRLARAVAVTLAERVPGGAPPGLHDPRLFVDRDRLRNECARHGVRVKLTGLRPSFLSVLAWALHRRPQARMVPTWSTAVLFQGYGTKEGP